MVVAGEVGFLLREKLTEFLVPIRWTRFCQNYFLGILIWQNRDCISRPQKGVWGMNAGGLKNLILAEKIRIKCLKNIFPIEKATNIFSFRMLVAC